MKYTDAYRQRAREHTRRLHREGRFDGNKLDWTLLDPILKEAKPPWGEVARKLGVDPQSLFERRKALGIYYPPVAKLDAQDTEAKIAEILAEDPRMPWRVVAKRLGVSLGTLARWRKNKKDATGAP